MNKDIQTQWVENLNDHNDTFEPVIERIKEL